MSGSDFLLPLAPVAGLSFLVLVHGLLRRAGPRGLLLPFLLASLAGSILALGLSAVGVRSFARNGADASVLVLLNVLTYVGLGFGYFNFVNFNVTSLRIRLLRELEERGLRGLRREELLQRYDTRQVLKLRVERLTGSGHLVRRGDRYYTGKRGILLIARLFAFLTWFILPARARRPVHAENIG